MAEYGEKLPHSCGSSDGLQVIIEGEKVHGYCFACGTYEADPYGSGVDLSNIPRKPGKTPSEREAEVQEVRGYMVHGLPNGSSKKKHLSISGVESQSVNKMEAPPRQCTSLGCPQVDSPVGRCVPCMRSVSGASDTTQT